MPLVKGKKAATKKGISENIQREMHADKPQKQAVAIALNVARKSGAKIPKKKNKVSMSYHGRYDSTPEMLAP